MSTETGDSIRTQRTLLSRLRNLDDGESWRRFFDLYWRLIYNLARRSGLGDQDAQDIVQETVISVARKMPGFQYDPGRGSFKQWLLRITRRRITDHLRKAYRRVPQVELSPELPEEDNSYAGAVVDPASRAIEKAWDEEWEQWRFDQALATVRRQANPKHFQVFDYCVVKGWPVSKVSATLGLNAAQVYLAKHRVGQAMKRAFREIAESPSF